MTTVTSQKTACLPPIPWPIPESVALTISDEYSVGPSRSAASRLRGLDRTAL